MTDAIKPIKREGKKITPAAQALEELKGMKAPDDAHTEAAGTPANIAELSRNRFFIDEHDEFFRMGNVMYRGELCDIYWEKGPLDREKILGTDNPDAAIQPAWIYSTRDSEWKVPDTRIYYASFMSMYLAFGEGAAEFNSIHSARDMFQHDFDHHPMMTSTVADYPNSRFIHNLEYETVTNKYKGEEIRSEVAGVEGLINIKNTAWGLGNTLLALFGTRSARQVEKVFEWISGRKPYLNRWESSKSESPVMLYNTDRRNVFCINYGSGHITGEARLCMVRTVEEFNKENEDGS